MEALVWIDIKLFVPPVKGSRRYDLLVRRNKIVVRVPDCFYRRDAKAWRNRWFSYDGVPCLRRNDEALYWMAEPEYPHHLDSHRRK